MGGQRFLDQRLCSSEFCRNASDRDDSLPGFGSRGIGNPIILSAQSGVTLPASGWTVNGTPATSTGGGTNPVTITDPVALTVGPTVTLSNSTATTPAVGLWWSVYRVR